MKGHARNLMSEKVFAVTGDTPPDGGGGPHAGSLGGCLAVMDG